jgi:hypothetical protein
MSHGWSVRQQVRKVTSRSNKKEWMLVCVALAAVPEARAQSFIVPPELWDRPRSALAIMEPIAIRQAVNTWLVRPGARIVVHHGANPESLVQAEEVRAWLISLAIEAGHVTLRNDLTPADPLQIEVTREP